MLTQKILLVLPPLTNLCNDNFLKQDIIHLMLKNGADPNILNNSHHTPLYYILSRNICPSLLLHYKANINFKSFGYIYGFEICVEYECVSTITEVLERSEEVYVSPKAFVFKDFQKFRDFGCYSPTFPSKLSTIC